MKILDNIIVRLVLYYVSTTAFFNGLFMLFPKIPYYIYLERERYASGPGLDLTPQAGAAGTPVSIENFDSSMVNQMMNPEVTVPVLMALIAAFTVTLPVTWVYHWTRPRKRYSQAFAHTLLVVPIAIALVVFLVKGSLALAFSLAGIVAAVRFRTSLDEPMDAVYMFITIGIGLSAGIHLLLTALIASVIFNAIALGVWRSNIGATPAVIDGWTLVETDESGQLLGVSGTLQPTIAMSGAKGEKPFNAQLRIHTTKVDIAQRSAFPILEANTSRWQVGQVIQQEDGTAIVEFDLRIKKSADLALFIQKIEQSEAQYVGKVELTKRKSKKEITA